MILPYVVLGFKIRNCIKNYNNKRTTSARLQSPSLIPLLIMLGSHLPERERGGTRDRVYTAG